MDESTVLVRRRPTAIVLLARRCGGRPIEKVISQILHPEKETQREREREKKENEP